MTASDTIAPSKEFERRYASQALESAIARSEPEILIRGPRGTGKTIMTCDFNYRLGYIFPGMKQVWLRKDRTDMTDTVLSAFEDEVLGLGHPLRIGGASREGRKGYDFGNGTHVLLKGMKGPDATKSMSADLIWLNECNELTEAEWEEIDAANRERVGVTTFPYQCKLGDFNPMPPSHWTNTRCAELPRHLYPRIPIGDEANMAEYFTPRMYAEIAEFNLSPLDRTRHKAKLIVSTIADNPGYWSIDPWGWKPAGLKYCLDKLAGMGANRRARYLEGRPVAVEGVVFPEFSRETHVLDVGAGAEFPNGWPRDWPVWVLYDPGYAHPCAVVYWGVAPNGDHYIVDEIHGSGWDIDKLGPAIKAKASKYRVVAWLDDPRGANQKTQISNGKTVRDYMREKFQLHFRPWKAAEGKAKQSQVEGVRSLLINTIQQRPKKLRVFHTCTGVIGEFESWKNKEDAHGQLLAGDDAYEDRNNDAMDCLCGAVADDPKFQIVKATVVAQR